MCDILNLRESLGQNNRLNLIKLITPIIEVMRVIIYSIIL